jgi:hypothetical protein
MQGVDPYKQGDRQNEFHSLKLSGHKVLRVTEKLNLDKVLVKEIFCNHRKRECEMQKDLEIRCQRKPWGSDIEFMAMLPRHDGGFDVGDPLTMRRLEPGEHFRDETFRLSNTAAQQLMDELWSCGLRPSEGTGSAGSLAATERHLKDMRTIALGILGKDCKLEGDREIKP